jgi:hypothetical protein
VYRPTMDEFKDFNKYVSSITKEVGNTVGIVKIIPPANFFERDYSLDCLSKCMTVKGPVRQLISGSSGRYTVDLLVIDDMTLKQFHSMAAASSYDSDCYEDRERKFWRSMGFGSGAPLGRKGCVSANTSASASPVAGAAEGAAADVGASEESSEGTGGSGSKNCWIDPVYGADAAGTLFDGEHACGWNVDDLDSMLRLLGRSLTGITNSMLYVGMWRAMFAFHVEDMNLYSINYVHTGAAKSWYSVPQRLQQRFETLAQANFPHDYHKCREFLRHKTSVLSPLKLRQAGISFDTAVQEAGEFIITLPGAYHQGFNHGFNVAEASNFALPDWIPLGRKADVCRCEPFNCYIDVDHLEALYWRRQRCANRQAAAYAAAAAASSTGEEGSKEVEAEAEDPSYFRCCCGMRGQLPLKLPPRLRTKGLKQFAARAVEMLEASSPDLFQCDGCGMYAHIDCTAAAFAKQYGQPHPPDAQLFCQICIGLELKEGCDSGSDSDIEVIGFIKGSDANGGRQSDDDGDSDEDGEDGYGWDLQSQLSVQRAAGDIVKIARKGDSVQLTASGAIGTIVDVYDDGSQQGRVHIRGTHRRDDIWINLQDTALYLVLSEPGAPLSPSSPGSPDAGRHKRRKL